MKIIQFALSKLRRISWISVLGFLLCGGFMLNRCYECSVKFMKGKLTTSNAIKSTNEIDFPAMTICPSYENPYKGKQINIILKNYFNYPPLIS